MKKQILHLALMLIIATPILAQKKSTSKSKMIDEPKQVQDDGKPKIFLQLSSGLDNPHGLFGIAADVAFKNKFMVGAGLGFSSWGTKYNLHGSYFLKENFLGSAFGISLNRSSGFFLNASATNGNQPANDFSGTLGPLSSVNIMYSRYWKVGKKSRFFMQTGIASKLSPLKMDLRYVSSGIIVNKESFEYGSTKILSPGGLIANLGFLLRLK